MILSKTCGYAIRASVFIGLKNKVQQRASIDEIAKAVGSPKAFTAKVLRVLVHKGILLSAKGPKGGFGLNNPKSTYLIDIISAIDGTRVFTSCVLGIGKCPAEHSCSLHMRIKPALDELLATWSNKTITDLVYDFESGSCEVS